MGNATTKRRKNRSRDDDPLRRRGTWAGVLSGLGGSFRKRNRKDRAVDPSQGRRASWSGLSFRRRRNRPPPTSDNERPRASSGGDIGKLGKVPARPRLTDFYDVTTDVIGRGHYATVVRARNKRTRAWVAVKRLEVRSNPAQALKREIEVLARVWEHPNIVTLHDIFVTDTEVQLVLELLEGGELLDRLSDIGPYNEKQASHHIRKIALALHFLHEQGIVHRDLKPENLILTSKADDAEIMIADFGLSRVVDDAKSSTMKTVCGTWAYGAPEVNRARVPGAADAAYTAKVDMWACGVIMFMILVAYHPFDVNGDTDDSELWSSINRGEFDFDDPAWTDISAGARDVLKKLIVVDPEKRLNTAQLLNHPWILQSGPAPRKSRFPCSRGSAPPAAFSLLAAVAPPPPPAASALPRLTAAQGPSHRHRAAAPSSRSMLAAEA